MSMSENVPNEPPRDPRNPYAPPDAEVAPARGYRPPMPGGQGFSASEVIGHAWEIYNTQFSQVVGIVITCLAIMSGYQLAVLVASRDVDVQTVMGFVADLVSTLAGMVLQLWLTSGQMKALVKVARGEDATVTEVFLGGPYVPRQLGATLLATLLAVAVAAVVVGPVAGVLYLTGRLATVGGVVLMALSLAVASFLVALVIVRIYQYMYAIVDQDMGVLESLRWSYRATRGRTFELGGLMIVAGLISVSGGLAGVLGLLMTLPAGSTTGILLAPVGLMFTIPLGSLIFACAYASLADDGLAPRRVEPSEDLDFG